jgi:hypothetical protein
MSDTLDHLDHAPSPDIARLIEDLAATLSLFAERRNAWRPILPSAALLATLGESYLAHAAAGTPFPHLHNRDFIALTEAWHWPTGVGDVQLSFFLAGLVLARTGMWTKFPDDQGIGGNIDWSSCLQWLIMHGATELGLKRFLHEPFLRAMQQDTVFLGTTIISPLEFLIARERPEWLTPPAPGKTPDFHSLVFRWTAEVEKDEIRAMFKPIDRRRMPRPSMDHVKRKIQSLKG